MKFYPLGMEQYIFSLVKYYYNFCCKLFNNIYIYLNFYYKRFRFKFKFNKINLINLIN